VWPNLYSQRLLLRASLEFQCTLFEIGPNEDNRVELFVLCVAIQLEQGIHITSKGPVFGHALLCMNASIRYSNT